MWSYESAFGSELAATNEDGDVIQLTEVATTTLPRQVAFEHVGDFGNVDKWDPGVMKATKATEGEPGVGTAYDLVLSFSGRQLEMRYVVREYEPGNKVVLEGNGNRVHAVDVITFDDYTDGTEVTYSADLSLTGIARFFEPLMRGRLLKVGEDGGAGLRRWLSELEEKFVAG